MRMQAQAQYWWELRELLLLMEFKRIDTTAYDVQIALMSKTFFETAEIDHNGRKETRFRIKSNKPEFKKQRRRNRMTVVTFSNETLGRLQQSFVS